MITRWKDTNISEAISFSAQTGKVVKVENAAKAMNSLLDDKGCIVIGEGNDVLIFPEGSFF